MARNQGLAAGSEDYKSLDPKLPDINIKEK
jgi:hypothetical protein